MQDNVGFRPCRNVWSSDKTSKEQVRRNIERFPDDFMFELSQKEWAEVVAICDLELKYRNIAPFAFTEQGVATLSGVLRSPTAIQVNIGIMRAFVAIRKVLYSATPKSIEERVKALEIANEELLKDMNDLSEDTRNNFDDLHCPYRNGCKTKGNWQTKKPDRIQKITFCKYPIRFYIS